MKEKKREILLPRNLRGGTSACHASKKYPYYKCPEKNSYFCNINTDEPHNPPHEPGLPLPQKKILSLPRND